MDRTLFTIPVELVAISIVVGGLFVLVGARRIGGRIIFWVIVAAILLPFIAPPTAELLRASPTWVVAVASAIVGLLVLQGLIGLIFGRQVAAHVTGDLLTRLILSIGRAAGWPWRWVRRAIRDLGGRGPEEF